jgi:hypothetical protein
MDANVVTDKDTDGHKAKRRKHSEADRKLSAQSHPHDDHHRRRHHHRSRITHYVVQLKPCQDGKLQGSEESLSSHTTSVEARLLGLSKMEARSQRLAVAAPNVDMETDELASESSNNEKEHVSAVG